MKTTKVAKKEKKIKSKKMTVDTLNNKLKRLENSLNLSESNLSNLKKYITKVETDLRFFKNKQTSEIRVLSKDGKWEGYTGVFYINAKDEEKVLAKKAVKHFEEYFQDVGFYENRTLGLFSTSPKGKKLIKVLQVSKEIDTDALVSLVTK